jgi:hypothetical protein
LKARREKERLAVRNEEHMKQKLWQQPISSGRQFELLARVIQDCAPNSTPGNGTTVTLHLPTRPAGEQVPAVTGRVRAEHDPGKRTILVVEDDPDVAELTSHMLERSGYSVRLTPSKYNGISNTVADVFIK